MADQTRRRTRQPHADHGVRPAGADDGTAAPKGSTTVAEREGDPPIEAFLDSLSVANRRTLAAAGFGMARLRALAGTEAGARQVRHIVAEFGASPGRRAAVRRLAGPGPADIADPAGKVAGFWLLYLLGAAVLLLVLLGCVVLVGQLLGVIVAVLGFTGLFLMWAVVPSAPWSGPAFLVTVPAMIVLLATTLLYSPEWYLAARGRDAQATVESPTYRWEHGARVATCRVRLPDGSVHGVRADGTCARTVGRVRPVVYDPAGRVGPAFGHRAGLGATARDVAGGAAGLTVLAAAVAMAGSVRRRGVR